MATKRPAPPKRKGAAGKKPARKPAKKAKAPVKPQAKAKKPSAKELPDIFKLLAGAARKKQPEDLRVHRGGAHNAKYKPEHAETTRRLLKNRAATDIELADFFEVSLRSIRNWKLQHPAFLAATLSTPKATLARVEASMYEQAIGMTIEEDHISVHKGIVTRTPVIKFIPGSASACMDILTNRDPANWKRRQTVALGGDPDNDKPVGVVIVPAKEP